MPIGQLCHLPRHHPDVSAVRVRRPNALRQVVGGPRTMPGTVVTEVPAVPDAHWSLLRVSDIFSRSPVGYKDLRWKLFFVMSMKMAVT